eukprot:Rhum_TRINITY_DN20898_c0_g1::Rhum_TRINITY_DN20898_c0_g1_i1::g.172237::m.172237
MGGSASTPAASSRADGSVGGTTPSSDATSCTSASVSVSAAGEEVPGFAGLKLSGIHPGVRVRHGECVEVVGQRAGLTEAEQAYVGAQVARGAVRDVTLFDCGLDDAALNCLLDAALRGRDEAAVLAAGVPVAGLSNLSLSGNPALTQASLLRVIALLRVLGVQALHVSRTGMDDACVAALADALPHNPQLRRVWMSGLHGITGKSVAGLAGVLPQAAPQLTVACGGCDGVSDASLMLLAQANIEAGENRTRQAAAFRVWMANAHSARGFGYLARVDLDGAHRCFTHALQLQPGLWRARYGMACATRKDAALRARVWVHRAAAVGRLMLPAARARRRAVAAAAASVAAALALCAAECPAHARPRLLAPPQAFKAKAKKGSSRRRPPAIRTRRGSGGSVSGGGSEATDKRAVLPAASLADTAATAADELPFFTHATAQAAEGAVQYDRYRMGHGSSSSSSASTEQSVGRSVL